ncbi:hypothetical protein JTL38_04275 [Pseudomonas aeruginosa]|nr:hypothetical protein [Pseudomonas aeruginosa]MBN0003784.1 hypothetical protein [Pseudomonas aeruginosa]MBN0232477.1 hypothetical protein [Pseudomonas aeruginosa]MBN0390898.1 hypothetical protein [Pseudomonas aeruginosa]MBN0633551.1 hypothetical protein [Pseudomonas aeruginosa]
MSDGQGYWVMLLLFIFCFVMLFDAKTDPKPCGKTETIQETAIRQTKKSQFYANLKQEAFFIALKEDEKTCRSTVESNQHLTNAKEFLKVADYEKQVSEIAKASRVIMFHESFSELLKTYSDEYACVKNIAVPFYAANDFYPHNFLHQNSSYIDKLVKTLEKTKLQEQNNFCS